MESLISQILVSLVLQIPLFCIYVLGIILALLMLSKCPRACVLAFLGLGILFVSSVVVTVIQIWLPHYWLQGHRGSAAELNWIFRGTSFLRSLLSAVGTALLVWAVFTGRATSPGRPVAGTQPPR